MLELLRAFVTDYPVGSGFLAVLLVALVVVMIDDWRRNAERVAKHDPGVIEQRRAEEARRVMQKTLDAVNAAYHKDRNHHWR